MGGGVRWMRFWDPLMRRLGEVLYKRQSQLPAIITSNVRVFAMVNYRPEDVVEDWLFLWSF